MEQLVTIELFGQPYTYKSESENENAQEVANFLVTEVNNIETQQSGKASNISNLAILIMAALNIANENFELKKNHSDLLKSIYDRSASLKRNLDNCIQKIE